MLFHEARGCIYSVCAPPPVRTNAVLGIVKLAPTLAEADRTSVLLASSVTSKGLRAVTEHQPFQQQQGTS